MVLTPTYHVFNMYKGFQEATYLPMDVKCDSMQVRDNRTIPMISTSAAKKADGSIIVSLANVNLDKAQEVELTLDGANEKSVTGEILTCKDIKDYNDFDHPETVKPAVIQWCKNQRKGHKS
jgi:alpha-N-arabinofuranosidase